MSFIQSFINLSKSTTKKANNPTPKVNIIKKPNAKSLKILLTVFIFLLISALRAN